MSVARLGTGERPGSFARRRCEWVVRSSVVSPLPRFLRGRDFAAVVVSPPGFHRCLGFGAARVSPRSRVADEASSSREMVFPDPRPRFDLRRGIAFLECASPASPMDTPNGHPVSATGFLVAVVSSLSGWLHCRSSAAFPDFAAEGRSSSRTDDVSRPAAAIDPPREVAFLDGARPALPRDIVVALRGSPVSRRPPRRRSLPSVLSGRFFPVRGSLPPGVSPPPVSSPMRRRR